MITRKGVIWARVLWGRSVLCTMRGRSPMRHHTAKHNSTRQTDSESQSSWCHVLKRLIANEGVNSRSNCSMMSWIRTACAAAANGAHERRKMKSNLKTYQGRESVVRVGKKLDKNSAWKRKSLAEHFCGSGWSCGVSGQGDWFSGVYKVICYSLVQVQQNSKKREM